MAEHHLAVLILEVLIEPQARTGLGQDRGELRRQKGSELAQQGERDPLRLSERAMQALSR
jgi:hypothetical protein